MKSNIARVAHASSQGTPAEQRAWRRYMLRVPLAMQFAEGSIDNAWLVDFSAIGLRAAFEAHGAPRMAVPRGANVRTLLGLNGESIQLEATLTRAYRNRQVLELCLSHSSLNPDVYGALLHAANTHLGAEPQDMGDQLRPVETLNLALDECFERIRERLMIHMEWARTKDTSNRPFFAMLTHLTELEGQIRMLAHSLLRTSDFGAFDSAALTQVLIGAFTDVPLAEDITPVLQEAAAQAAVVCFSPDLRR